MQDSSRAQDQVERADRSQPKIGTQPIGDAEISYLLYESEGPPLILLHATGFQPWLWHPLARDLARDFRVFSPYFCDHRVSKPPQEGISWLTLAEDLARLCGSLGIERPFLAGHSMGATVMMIAHAQFALPSAGMVLIEPILLPAEFYKLQLTLEQHPWASKAIRRTNHWRDRSAVMAYLHSRPLFQKWDSEVLDLYVAHGMVGGENGGLKLACSPQHEADLFMGGGQFDPWPLLERVFCPVLILEGGKSNIRPFLDIGRMRSLLKTSDYRLLANAGHLIPMEQPRETTRIIRDFFQSLTRSEAAVVGQRDQLPGTKSCRAAGLGHRSPEDCGNP